MRITEFIIISIVYISIFIIIIRVIYNYCCYTCIFKMCLVSCKSRTKY